MNDHVIKMSQHYFLCRLRISRFSLTPEIFFVLPVVLVVPSGLNFLDVGEVHLQNESLGCVRGSNSSFLSVLLVYIRGRQLFSSAGNILFISA